MSHSQGFKFKFSPMTSDKNLKYWNQKGPEKNFNNPNLILQNPQLLKVTDRILDVGCGYGRTLIELKLAGFENIFGVDYSPEMILAASSKPELSDVNLTVSVADKLPFADNSFDAVLLFAVLNCLPEIDLEVAAIKEAKRVVKKSGYVCINDFLASESLLSENSKRIDRYGASALILIEDQCLMRHTTTERAEAMTFGTKIIDWKVRNEISMNGNPVQILSYILKKT